MLLANGRLDPVANISGGASYPVDATANGTWFNTSFPPMDYVTRFLLSAYGCGSASRAISYQNGTRGN
eukprot:4458581-Prymnesium_polylepis.1